MTKDENNSRVINGDNTTGTNTIVQFNPTSNCQSNLTAVTIFPIGKLSSPCFCMDMTSMVTLMDLPRLPTRAPLLAPTRPPTLLIHFGSKQAWDSLHNAYANKSQTRIFSLRDQLARITIDSLLITEYLQRIRSLSDELATVGAPVTNSELIVKILSGLGPEFREISAAIRACDTTVTYEELYQKLLDHELFLRHEEVKKMQSPITAEVATRNKPTNNSNNRNNRRQNNNGTPTQNPLEWRQNARSNPPAQWQAPTNNNFTSAIRCQLCNKIGHIASVCRSKSHNHFEAKANYACGFTSTANPWIMDSGATHHLITEPHNLQEYHDN
ncbi:PREDICTED: uncharacterized protein LOC109234778 [Nicotiana attenuata]|uniref:uncharacterized protein LOC109234778 n=1 Tax=Nicotiana attenuata TaxID=49451 RepID=UPI000904CB2F|nr:PREDICTED: uncharacterized protein LOC109234778 [Nicotiana attenuata]